MEYRDKKMVSDLKAITGVNLRLSEYDSIVSVKLGMETILVCIETYDVTETVRETRYNRCGKRIVALEKKGSRWRVDDFMDTVWYDDFEPFVLRHFGRTETIAEREARIDWQTMCHRPGNAQFPLDNAEAIDEDYTPKMKDYFEK